MEKDALGFDLSATKKAGWWIGRGEMWWCEPGRDAALVGGQGELGADPAAGTRVNRRFANQPSHQCASVYITHLFFLFHVKLLASLTF
jgi:hypothetical protein